VARVGIGKGMTLTVTQIAKSTGGPISRASVFASWLNKAMQAYDITTPARQAAFLAQIGHESGGLRYTREIWGPTPAQQRYEWRKDLGNTQRGDGKLFMGRGLIQITGRANYESVGKALGRSFVDRPELLETAEWASLSAAWFFDMKGLNELADEGEFERITRRINGGINGLDDRLARWEAAKEVLA
jgi:putative chitinase